MTTFGKLNIQDLALLNAGCRTDIIEEGKVVVQHFHFVGAPFSGFWKKKSTKNQIKRKEEARLNESKKWATRKPAMRAIRIDEGWDFILANDNLNELDVAFVDDKREEKVVALIKRGTQRVREACRQYMAARSYTPPQNECPIEATINLLSNDEVVNVEAEAINQEQHSLEGNIDSMIIDTAVGTFYFEKNCKDFKEFVAELMNKRIDCEDDEIAERLTPLLFGQITDCQIFKILGNLWWDQFMDPQLVLPLRFSTIFDDLNVNSEWAIIERFQILSTPPQMHMEKENTKRNSKRKPPTGNDRIVRLENSNPEVARKLKEKQDYNRLQRIYAIQKKQRITNSDKMIEKLNLHSFGIPIKITFPQFQNLAEKALQVIPKQIRDKIHWVDIITALYSLIYSTDYASRWMAIRMLYINFKVEGIEFAIFAALFFKVYKLLGDNGEVKCPKIHAEMAKLHYTEASASSIIVTLILTILFKQDPRKNTVDKILSSFKDIPTASTGMEMVVNAANKTFEYISGSYSDENSLEFRLNKLDKDVKQLVSPEGQRRMKEERGVFEEIYLMKVESLELAKFIRANSTQGVLLNRLSYDINTQYSKAQILGASGHGYRKRPVVLHLNGGAGIGKTRLINYISADTISLILQLENEKYLKDEHKEELREKVKHYEQFVYFRPVGLKYQQNFKSYASKIYVCDDANQIIPSFQNGEMTYPMELIHLNNSHDHMLNVAEIEKKADALFKSALVIATDNIPRPDLYYLVCGDAYDRRIDFSFTVQIKPEFRKTRVGNSGFRYEVDLTKIDPSESNTNIYEFLDDHNIKYTYEEVIEMVEEKLIEVSESHITDTKLFGQRALKRFEERKFNLTTPLAATMAEHFKEDIGGASKVLFRKAEESVEILNNDKPLVAGIFKNFRRKTRNIYTKLRHNVNDIVEDVVENVEEKVFPIKELTFKEKVIDLRNTFQIALIAFMLRFVSWQTLDSWERKVRKTKTFISSNKELILATTGVLSTLLLGYMYFRKTKASGSKNDYDKRRDSKSKQGKYDGGQPSKSAPKGKAPPKTPIKSTPVFQSDNACEKEVIQDIEKYIKTPDLQAACQRASSMTKILISNCYYVFAEYTSNGKKQLSGLRGFFLRDRIFVTNRHLLPLTKEEFDTVKFSLYNIYNTYEDIPVSKVAIHTFIHESDDKNLYYDLIWIDFSKINMKLHADVCKYSSNGGSDNFLSEAEMNDVTGTKIIVCTLSIATEFAQIDHKLDFTGKNSWYFEMQHTRVTQVNSEAMECTGREEESLYTYKTFEYPMQSYPGYCGSVVVANDSSYPGKILGIHMAGYHSLDKSFGQLITKEMIESIGSAGVHMSRIEGNYNTLIRADEFSFLRTVPHVVRSPSKTKLRKSIFYNKIYTSQKEPAHLSFTPDGEHVITKSVRKYRTPHIAIPCEQEKLFNSILFYKVSPHRKIRELNRIESIKGIEGNEYICPINRKSSAGYPLNVETKKSGKHEYLGENEEWIVDHPRVEELINDFYDSVKRNERPNVVFVATIKDELLKKSKVAEFKSRAFAAAPLHYTIIFRERYLDYFATVMENKIKNYSLIGVNMYSSDVDTIVNLLIEVAPRNSKQFLAGDFSNFDGTLNLNLLWQIYNFIERIYGRESKVCEALWNELVDSQQLFGNTVVHIPKGQPSGNPATTLINTLYNEGLSYMVLFEVMEEIGTLEAYKVQENLIDYYRGVYYGDDNLHSFHKRITNIMDPNLITKVMKNHGHIYTTDAKDTTHFEYRFLNDVTILKRHFSYDKVANQWIAPLELVSIFEPINWDRVQDGRYEMKEIQMQVNVRTAIRELALHTEDVFDEYVPKLLNESKKYGLTLDPECYYDQRTLRKIIRNSDNLLFFSNDYYPVLNKPYNIDVDLFLEDKWGTTIQLGGHPESSPLEDSQKPRVHMLNPTVNYKQWIANTYEEYKQENNNKNTHALNGNPFIYFKTQLKQANGLNPVNIVFENIPAQKGNLSIFCTMTGNESDHAPGYVAQFTCLNPEVPFEFTLTYPYRHFGGVQSQIYQSFYEKVPEVLEFEVIGLQGITNFMNYFITVCLEYSPSETEMPNPLPVLVQNSISAQILNIPLPVTGETVELPQPLWVTQYDPNDIPTLKEKPQLHMMQYSSPSDEQISGQQVVTLDTVTSFKNESVPRHVELDLEKLKVMAETRDHSIKDILCRMYAILDIEQPAGGTTGTPIVELDLLAELLSQNNVSAKLEGFAIMRTNLIVTVVTRTLATTSGGLIASFYPQFSDLTNRNKNVLQNSQTPNKRINLAGAEGIKMVVPFISAFYGKNLITDSGSIGNFVLKQLTQLNINSTGLRIYIQADESNIKVEYPTFATGPARLRNIELRLNDLYQEQAQALRGVRMEIVNDRILRVEANERLPVDAREVLPDLIPRMHMMRKSITSAPVKSVKWHPGMNHLNKDGTDVAHSLAMTRKNQIKAMKGQFGSQMDEMSIEHIGKSQQIVAVKRVLTSNNANRIVYARPCSIIDFTTDNEDIFITHQTWLAMKAQKWSANLHFEITAYINNFHSVTLRAIFNPGDTGNFNEGENLNLNNINKAKSKVMEFDGQRMISQFVVEPALTTAMKNVPTPRPSSVNANINEWLASCFTEECSYGMFYLTVEVPLHSSAQVAPYFDFTVDFHVSNFLLGDPCEFDQVLPSVHMMKSGLTAEVAETSHQQTRSDTFENAMEAEENAANTSENKTIQTCLGDDINHIKDFLHVFTPFCPIKQVEAGNVLQINPFIFRALNDMPLADQFQNSDSIDYFSAGYGYYQGGMDIRIGKTTEQQGPFGELMLTSARNRAASIVSTSGTGTAIIPANTSARSGCRVLPLYKEECIPQVTIPYYQPFHIARITNSNSYNSGNQPKIMLLRPYNSEFYRIFRAARNDFTFGFLTALPPFRLVVGSMYN